MSWQKQCERINAELQQTKANLQAQNARLKSIEKENTDALICPTIVANYLRDMASYIAIWLHTPELMRAVAQTILEDNVAGSIRQEINSRSPRIWGIKQQVHHDLCVAVRHALQNSAAALEEENSNDY